MVTASYSRKTGLKQWVLNSIPNHSTKTAKEARSWFPLQGDLAKRRPRATSSKIMVSEIIWLGFCGIAYPRSARSYNRIAWYHPPGLKHHSVWINWRKPSEWTTDVLADNNNPFPIAISGNILQKQVACHKLIFSANRLGSAFLVASTASFENGEAGNSRRWPDQTNDPSQLYQDLAGARW